MNAYWVQNTEKWTKNEQQREGGLICSFPTFAYPLKTSESLTANKQIPEDKWFGQNEKETKKRKMAGWSGGEERERVKNRQFWENALQHVYAYLLDQW